MPTNTTTLMFVRERAVWRVFVWFQTGAKDSVLVVVIVGAEDGITVALFAKIAWTYLNTEMILYFLMQAHRPKTKAQEKSYLTPLNANAANE